eukprot:gene1133-10647_t
MGNCFGGEKKTNSSEKPTEKTKLLDTEKFILLGCGESGKSTFLKQIRLLFNDKLCKTEKEENTYINSILGTIAGAMLSIDEFIKEQNLSYENEEHAEYAAEVKKYVNENKTNLLLDGRSVYEAHHQQIVSFFSDKVVKENLDRASTQNFLSKIEKINGKSYELTDEDVLRCRRKTTGMNKFECKPVKDGKEFSKTFTFIDVGGQRNERRKWLKTFQDNFQCLIFVSSLSEYNQKCYEDDITNRMLESLDLFDEQINGEFFKDKPIILFLNKMDLFKEKIQQFPLKDLFKDYDGPEKDEKSAIEFITKQFCSKNQFAPDRIHVYVTEAINIDMVQKSFNEILELSASGKLKVE